MKIAVVTEDGTNISRHYGRAPLYLVVTIEDGRITGKEERQKTGHHTFAAHHPPEKQEGKHGLDAGARVRHRSMIDTITDCQVLLAGGMGQGAYEGLKERGIEPVLTDVSDIEAAVELYRQGTLENHPELLH